MSDIVFVLIEYVVPPTKDLMRQHVSILPMVFVRKDWNPNTSMLLPLPIRQFQREERTTKYRCICKLVFVWEQGHDHDQDQVWEQDGQRQNTTTVSVYTWKIINEIPLVPTLLSLPPIFLPSFIDSFINGCIHAYMHSCIHWTHSPWKE